MRKMASCLAMMMFFTFGIITTEVMVSPTVAYAAEDASVTTVADSINKADDGALSKSSANGQVKSLFKDLKNLALLVAIGILTITAIFTSVKFSNAGDNPQAKATLKSALIYQVLGLIFLGSVFGLIALGLKISLFTT